MKQSVEVAAVIVTYNSEQHVVELLDSLPSALGGLSYSVVVVDNGSTDGTLELLDHRTDCTVIRSTNDGYAAGINRAVRSSPDASSILVLNPDATLDSDSVPRMIGALRRPGVGIVAPRVREADGSLSPTLRRGPTFARVGGLSFTRLPAFAERIEDEREYETEHEVEWAVGAILLIDRECYDTLGGLDESYFLYSEETDFSLRAKDAGWSTVYTPNAGAMHAGGGSGESATTHTMKILNRVRIYRRRAGDIRASMYFGLTVLIELRRAILGHRKSWPTVRALLRPSLRPPMLGASDSLLPPGRRHERTGGRAESANPRRMGRMAGGREIERGRKRILMVAPACDGQDVGESWVAFQWATQLSQHFELTLLTTFKRGHVPASRQLPGVRVIEWGEPPLLGRLERLNSLMQPAYVPFYARARRWIRARLAEGERFDVVHQVVPVAMRYQSPAAGLGIPFVIGPVGGSLESPPAFAIEEGGTPWYQRLRKLDGWRIRHDPLLRRTFESADCVVGVAPYVAEFLTGLTLRRFEIMSETAIHEIRPPVDRSGRAGPVRLLHVGRTVRTKGLRDVIRAMDRLRDLDVVLDVLGDGNDHEACEALVRDLGLEDRITFHGTVPRATVDEFYERADVFVFPSYREPGGNVSIEAMAFGLPLVVCDRGGPGANVDDSCAFRLRAVSPAQLAADCATALRSLIEDPELRLRMGAAARAHAARNHLWHHRLERMSTLYDEVSSLRPSNRSSRPRPADPPRRG